MKRNKVTMEQFVICTVFALTLLTAFLFFECSRLEEQVKKHEASIRLLTSDQKAVNEWLWSREPVK